MATKRKAIPMEKCVSEKAPPSGKFKSREDIPGRKRKGEPKKHIPGAATTKPKKHLPAKAKKSPEKALGSRSK